MIKIQTENSCENTNAPPALPIGNASALWASKGVHNNSENFSDIFIQLLLLKIWVDIFWWLL